MVEPTLFDADPFHVPAEPAVKLTGDKRRIQRQEESLLAGWHPLNAAGYRLRLHADAPTDRLNREAPGLRCGGCRFREVLGHHSRSYGKCTYRPGDTGGYARITHGPGTDIRAWWPACVDFLPKEAADAGA